MKKIIASMLVLSTLVFGAMGEGKGNTQGNKQMKMFQSVDMKKATIVQSGDAKMYCPTCGMTLPMFYKQITLQLMVTTLSNTVLFIV